MTARQLVIALLGVHEPRDLDLPIQVAIYPSSEGFYSNFGAEPVILMDEDGTPQAVRVYVSLSFAPTLHLLLADVVDVLPDCENIQAGAVLDRVRAMLAQSSLLQG